MLRDRSVLLGGGVLLSVGLVCVALAQEDGGPCPGNQGVSQPRCCCIEAHPVPPAQWCTVACSSGTVTCNVNDTEGTTVDGKCIYYHDKPLWNCLGVGGPVTVTRKIYVCTKRGCTLPTTPPTTGDECYWREDRDSTVSDVRTNCTGTICP
jgi:hypothetical protein